MKICLKLNMNIEDKKSKRRIMQCIAGIEGVASVAVDTKERIITVIGDTDLISLWRVLRKNGFSPELLSVGPAKEEKKVGWDTENRGRNPYLGMQRTEAVGGFGGVNRAIAYRVGRRTRIMEVVAGFGDLTSINVDLKEYMVTVVGKSVPVSVALKVRKMGYRAKLVSLGPATEEEDTDEDTTMISIPAISLRIRLFLCGFPLLLFVLYDKLFVLHDKFPRNYHYHKRVGLSFVRLLLFVTLLQAMAVQTVGSKWDTENRGKNLYLGMQRREAVGGFGGMNRAIEDSVGSETRIMEAVAGFGDLTSIKVDNIKGMVTVVGKSVPVSVALKVRKMGYRAKLLSLGPATEEEDTSACHRTLRSRLTRRGII